MPTKRSIGSALAEAVCVPPSEVEYIWGCVYPWIKRAMERGDLGTFDAVEDDVINGRALLWLVWNDPDIDGCAVTQLGRTEKSKVCTIVACGGEDARHWVSLIRKIEEYAKAEGCDAVRILGRKGWLRLLPDYNAPKVVLEKRLT